MEKTGAQILVEGLRVEGVSHLFGITGSPLLPILDVIYRTPGIRFVQSQNEQFAMFMANGYARAGRRTGVCMVTRGPGATNAMTGVALAFYNAVPGLLIAAEEGSLFHGLETSLFHNLDGSVLFKPVTKLARRIERADRIPESLQTAFRLANTGRRGPVYLGIPRQVTKEKARVAFDPPERSRIQNLPKGNPRDVAKAAELLAEAQNPVALAGGGLAWSDAQGVLLEMAELLAMPVGATRGNKGIVPETHPLALGVISHGGAAYTIETFQESDLVLAVGTTFEEFTVDRFGYRVIPRKGRMIHIDLDPAEIGKIYPVDVGIMGDARSVLEDILAELRRRKPAPAPFGQTERVKKLLRRKKQWQKKIGHLMHSDKIPIQRGRLMHDLHRALPEDALVSGTSGSTHQWFEYAYPATVHATQIGGWGAMGAEYCEALGAQLALPQKRVVCIMGDGAAMMSLQELQTAVTYNIPVLAVVCHNDLFGNIHYSQLKRFGGRFIGTNIKVPNLADVARVFGAFGERVVDPGQIIPAVHRALDSGKPALLDVMIDTSPENLAPPGSFTEAATDAQRQADVSLSSRNALDL